MNRKKIGEYISFLRKKNNLTQEELSKKIYVTRQAVSKWEQGKSVPDSSSLERLSEIFDVPIESFIVYTYDDVLEKDSNTSVFLSLTKEDSNCKEKELVKDAVVESNNLTINDIYILVKLLIKMSCILKKLNCIILIILIIESLYLERIVIVIIFLVYLCEIILDIIHILMLKK